jgi:hypothetical protein
VVILREKFDVTKENAIKPEEKNNDNFSEKF